MTASQSTESVGRPAVRTAVRASSSRSAEHGHIRRQGPCDPVPEPPGQGRAGPSGGDGHDDRSVAVDGGKLHRAGRVRSALLTGTPAAVASDTTARSTPGTPVAVTTRS